eukprot:6204369-Pleurochrysis_carterae.AAC.3
MIAERSSAACRCDLVTKVKLSLGWLGGHSETFVCAHFSGRANKLEAEGAIYGHIEAEGARILRAEHELRQQGARRLPRAEKRQLTTWRRTWRSEVRTGSGRTTAFVNAK